MLELLRKYQYGLMFVVAVVVIIAFAFLYDRNSYGSQRVENAFTVYGDTYTDADLQRGINTFQLCQNLGLYDFLGSLYGQRRDGSPQEFIYQHIILKKEALEMGLHASQEAIEEKIRSLSPFQFQGKFDQTAFDNFKTRLGSYGYTMADLYDLVGDAVVLDKMKELLAANFVPASTEVDDSFKSRYQKVQSYKIELKKEDYAKDITVSDEEIAEYYEENKEALMSDARRAVEYVHFIAPKFEDPKPATSPIPGGLTPPEMLRAPEETTDPLAIPDLGDLDSNTSKPDTSGLLDTDDATPAPAPDPAPAPEEDAAASSEPAEPVAVEDLENADGSDCQGGEEVVEEGTENTPEPAAEPAAEDTENTAEPVAEPAAEDTKAVDDIPAAEEKEPAAAEPAKTEPAKTEPAAETAETKPAASEAPKAATPEERRAAKKEFNLAIEAVLENVIKGGDFSEEVANATVAAAGKKYEIKNGKTDLFTQEEPPEPLKGNPQLIREIFSRPVAQPVSNPPVRVGEDFYMFKLTEVEEPEQLSLDDAKEKIREILLAEKTEEALKKAAEEVTEKLNAELKKGAKITDAAKAVNVTAERIDTFEGSAVPPAASGLRQVLNDTVAGQISEPSLDEDKATLVYIASRTVTEDAEKTAEDKKKSISDQLADFNYENVIFNAWLDKARQKANPKPDDLGLGRNVM